MEVGRLFGIPIRIDWTFSLLVLVVAYLAAQSPAPEMAIAQFAVIIGAVLVHELGHAFAARQMGVQVYAISLNVMVALTHMEQSLEPEDPRREMWIVAAGPLANLVLACLLLPAAVLTWTPAIGPGFSVLQHGIASWAVAVNLILCVANLAPGLPMDGGMLLRAALTKRMGRVPATNVAASIGSFIALACIVLGIAYGQFWLLLLGGYIWLAAQRERLRTIGIERLRQAGLGGIPPELAALVQGLGMTPEKLREMMSSSRPPSGRPPMPGNHSPFDPDSGPRPGPGPTAGGRPGMTPEEVARQIEIDLARMFGGAVGGGPQSSGPSSGSSAPPPGPSVGPTIGPSPRPGTEVRKVQVEVVNVETNRPSKLPEKPAASENDGNDGNNGNNGDDDNEEPAEGHFTTRDGRHFYKGQELMDD